MGEVDGHLKDTDVAINLWVQIYLQNKSSFNNLPRFVYFLFTFLVLFHDLHVQLSSDTETESATVVVPSGQEVHP